MQVSTESMAISAENLRVVPMILQDKLIRHCDALACVMGYSPAGG
jgi:hypothetical protein